MSCPNCGAPSLIDDCALCIECQSAHDDKTAYTYDENDETLTCTKCGETNDWTDPRAFVDNDPTNMLWRCPGCGNVIDLAL